MKKHPQLRAVLCCLLFVIILPLTSFAAMTGLFGLPLVAAGLLWPAALTALYLLLRKRLIPAVITVNGILAAAVVAAFTVLMILADGNTDGLLMQAGLNTLGSFLSPGLILFMLMMNGKVMMLMLIILTTVLAFFLSVLLQKRTATLKKAWPGLAAVVLCIGLMGYLYANRPSVRYGGHGFAYMHGWSSTDFTDYMVYSEPSRLVSPDSPAELMIEGEENMPVMDGAEACFPVYAAAAKAVYRDIAEIEKGYLKDDEIQQANGKIVCFTNTVSAFWRLINSTNGERNKGDIDLFFGAIPSKSQLASAEENKVELEITPIGREAFVFFVEPDNPVTNLTSGQIRQIYHGDITNWAEVGGKNQEIRAFQRPENSGSQTMMQYFMGDVTLKAPKTFEYVGSMGGVVQEVAQYANEAGAIGYSFRYFVEDLSQENDVRVIAVDGVRPTLENIKNGSYPLSTALCLITRKNDPNPNVQKMIDFMLSDAGQEIVEKTGYAGLSR